MRAPDSRARRRTRSRGQRRGPSPTPSGSPGGSPRRARTRRRCCRCRRCRGRAESWREATASDGARRTVPARRDAVRSAHACDQIALQLYTVRDLAARMSRRLSGSWRSRLPFVEVAGLPEMPAGDAGGLLADAGLQAIAATRGSKACAAAPRPSPSSRGTRAPARSSFRGCRPRTGYGRRRPSLRRRAERVRASLFASRGIRFGYHNHAFEFEDARRDDRLGHPARRARPGGRLEVDVYWAAVGGRDRRAHRRCRRPRPAAAHEGPDRRPGPGDGPAGQGSLDFPSIVAAGRAAGVEWYIAEQDNPRSAVDDIATAYDYLRLDRRMTAE